MFNKEFVFNQPLNASGLALKTAGDPAAKTTAAINYKLNGKLYTKAAIATITPPSDFIIETGYQQGLTIYLNAAGTVSFSEGVTKANTEVYNMADFDHSDVDLTIIGWILVKNATGSQFVGGTTDLDVSNLTVMYIENFGISGF